MSSATVKSRAGSTTESLAAGSFPDSQNCETPERLNLLPAARCRSLYLAAVLFVGSCT